MDKKQALGAENIRHSLAHLLAAAVLRKYPNTKLGIGPVIENGFYYDFQFAEPVSETELKEFENAMRELIAQNLEFVGEKITPAAARKIFKNQPFKLDLIAELSKNKKPLKIYKTGDFFDLCQGGHVKNTSEINPDCFRITKLAGAYWRGDEKKPQLTRIYGTAFADSEELARYLKILEEAEKRDHRKLGAELGLFMFHETAPGMPYWLPKGLIVFNELVNFWRVEHEKRGYQEIRSPLLNKKELYLTSGHWDHYRENMFIAETAEGETYALKPMNCPNAMIVFGSRARSYRELPMRLSDTDTLHRFERSGTLNGLLRVREFSQDDAHVFVSEDQIQSECENILEIAEYFYRKFGLDYSFRLGTRPKDFMGDPKLWRKAESQLKDILEKSGKPYSLNEGDGSFYGPKIDIFMKDSLGRDWQMGTIQLDFQIPRRFGLEYVSSDGSFKTPVVIHRVIYGALERFIGVLIEHTAGALPFWLAPTQIAVLNINDAVKNYCLEVANILTKRCLRTNFDDRNETVGKKIREAELQKIPYIMVIGPREAESKTITARKRGKGDLGQMRLEDFLKLTEDEFKNYSNNRADRER